MTRGLSVGSTSVAKLPSAGRSRPSASLGHAVGDPQRARQPARGRRAIVLDQPVAEQTAIVGQVMREPIAQLGRAINQTIDELERKRVAAGERSDLGRRTEREQQVQTAQLRRIEPERVAQPIERQRFTPHARQREARRHLLVANRDLDLELCEPSRRCGLALEHAARERDDVVEMIAPRPIRPCHVASLTHSALFHENPWSRRGRTAKTERSSRRSLGRAPNTAALGRGRIALPLNRPGRAPLRGSNAKHCSRRPR